MNARAYRHHPSLLDVCSWWLRRDEPNTWQPPGGHEIATSWAATTCSWCRQRHSRDLGAHRARPSLPVVEGCCRLCGDPLTGRRRSWCSDSCGQLWMGAGGGPTMFAHLVELHGWYCWSCGDLADALEVDHIRPLWSLTDEERTEHRWWLPFNLQLLCVACHKAKTKHEAGVRALGLRNVAMSDAEQMLLM